MTNFFDYKGYKIPVHLVNITGGGTDTFDIISKGHISNLQKYISLNSNDNILEVGCGIGRDAIPLTEILNNNVQYLGIDIIKDSIDWCTNNITKKFNNFKFIHYDVRDQLHNPTGKTKTVDIILPIEDNSIDKIILWSVFTHMFPYDINHYLKEFNRVLKPSGLCYITVFEIFNNDVLVKARETNKTIFNLSFEYPLTNDIFINDPVYPCGAVAYSNDFLTKIINDNNFTIIDGIRKGTWSGYYDNNSCIDGQDVLILKKM